MNNQKRRKKLEIENRQWPMINNQWAVDAGKYEVENGNKK